MATATRRERLRYGIDRLFARGSSGPLLWLGGAALVLTLLGAVAFTVFGIEFDGRSGLGESLWRSFLIAIGKGSISNAGWAKRILTLLFVFASLFLSGSLIGLLVSAINRRLDDIRRGRSRVIEQDHTLVLGESARLLPVIDELLASPTSTPVVILSETDKTELEDVLRTRHPKPDRRLVIRQGTPSSRSDLDLVGIEDAESVIVLNNGSAVDAITVRRALTANSYSPDRVHVVAETSNPRIARSLRESTAGQVATANIDATVADMLTQAVRAPGMARLFDDLLSFGGAELHLVDASDLVGLGWLDVSASLPDAVALGVTGEHGEVELLPPVDRVIGSGDRLVVLSDGASPAMVRTAHQPQPDFVPVLAGSPHEQIMVLGWSRVGEQMLRDLDGFLPRSASVVVYADASMLASAPPDGAGLGFHVEFVSTKHDPEEIRAAIEARQPDVLVVLGYLSTVSEDEADALTLLTLHTVDRSSSPPGHRPRVVAQMLNSETGALVSAAHGHDYVLTDAIVSRMLVHLARDRRLAPVFDELFCASGPSIRFVALPDGEYPVDDLKMMLAERAMALIGLSTPDGTVLNPAGSTTVELRGGDRLLALGRFALLS